ncbi:MAG: glycosyltransferase family 2 protein [Candidatus Pacearchaeota archaeon]|nr:MAG: glycosyltransferase family 2 protein [Candidatus Pacearchaeota archaeon]
MVDWAQIYNPLFFILVIIFLYCCYILYFALTVRRKRIKHEYFPYVSVLVYAKDAGNVIRRRIENLIKQNYPKNKYEIIIYDNASKDETQEICMKYKKKKLIKYLRKKFDRKGPLLDLAIKKLAKGEILLMTDPDVLAEKNWILNIVQPFKDKSVGAVAGTVHCGNYYKGIIPLMRAVEDEWRFVAPVLRDSDTVFSIGANQALRRETWEQTKYGGSLLDDLDIISRIIDKGWKAVGSSATGTEEEVETPGQYWRQRTRWYKVNTADYFGVSKKWKKFLESFPHVIQFFALVLLIVFIISLSITFNYLIWFSIINFVLMNLAMIIAFIKIKTGKAFIPAIPLFLTLDTILFGTTLFWVHIPGRFFHLTKEVWPSLQGRYYHVGSELKKWFFEFEEKVKDYTKI